MNKMFPILSTINLLLLILVSYSEVRLVNHMIVLILTFWGTSILFFLMAISKFYQCIIKPTLCPAVSSNI